jgi:integrase
LFNIAIDSKLRGCDVVALKVDDIAPSGYAADRASVRQKKTGRPVKFELTEATREAIDDYLRTTGKKPGDRLFTGRRGPDRSLTTRQYARPLSDWLAGIGLDPEADREPCRASLDSRDGWGKVALPAQNNCKRHPGGSDARHHA